MIVTRTSVLTGKVRTRNIPVKQRDLDLFEKAMHLYMMRCLISTRQIANLFCVVSQIQSLNMLFQSS